MIGVDVVELPPPVRFSPDDDGEVLLLLDERVEAVEVATTEVLPGDEDELDELATVLVVSAMVELVTNVFIVGLTVVEPLETRVTLDAEDVV